MKSIQTLIHKNILLISLLGVMGVLGNIYAVSNNSLVLSEENLTESGIFIRSYSGDLLSINTTDLGWLLPKNQGAILNVWSECKDITSLNGYNLFIPTRSQNEWQEFKANLPSNVVMGDCASTNSVMVECPCAINAGATCVSSLRNGISIGIGYIIGAANTKTSCNSIGAYSVVDDTSSLVGWGSHSTADGINVTNISILDLRGSNLEAVSNAGWDSGVTCRRFGNVTGTLHYIGGLDLVWPQSGPMSRFNYGCYASTYSWQQSGFGVCNASCGGGTQTQIVNCIRDDGVTVADTYCSGTKPNTTQSCNTQACTPPNSTICSGLYWSNQTWNGITHDTAVANCSSINMRLPTEAEILSCSDSGLFPNNTGVYRTSTPRPTGNGYRGFNTQVRMMTNNCASSMTRCPLGIDMGAGIMHWGITALRCVQ